MTLEEISERISRMTGARDVIRDRLQDNKKALKKAKQRAADIEEARAIIQLVAKQTQDQLCWSISEIVTLAQAAVFPDPYEFAVEFEMKRGRTAAKLVFKRGEAELDPMDASGGGPVDVAAFALRVAMWSIRNPRSRPTLVLDEPFKNVSKKHRDKAGEMLKEVSEKLGLQIIMVTHDPALVEAADRVFTVTMKNGVSKVEVE